VEPIYYNNVTIIALCSKIVAYADRAYVFVICNVIIYGNPAGQDSVCGNNTVARVSLY